MSLTPTTRSTPQASLEIMYNIPPLDLFLRTQGISTYLRLKTQLDPTWEPKNNTISHLHFWDQEVGKSQELWQGDDRCFEVNCDSKINFNMDSLKGGSKHLIKSQVTIYTDGSKTNQGVGSGYVIYYKGERMCTYSTKLPDYATVFQAEIQAIYEACQVSKIYYHTTGSCN